MGGGSYTVNDVGNSMQGQELAGELCDAIIGSNLFMYLPLLFDGVNNTLGIVEQP